MTKTPMAVTISIKVCRCAPCQDGAYRLWAALELLRWMEQAKIPYPEELRDVVLSILEAEAGLYRGGMTEKTPVPAGASLRGL